MIRFIDLRFQGTGARFAFWDTVHDCFVEDALGEQAWDTWDAFVENCGPAAERCRALCSPWVFEAPTEEQLGFLPEGQGTLLEWCGALVAERGLLLDHLRAVIHEAGQIDCDYDKVAAAKALVDAMESVDHHPTVPPPSPTGSR